MRKKIQVTQEDIDLAIKTFNGIVLVTKCCPVFQALKRSGVNIKSVGYDMATLDNEDRDMLYLSKSIRKITGKGSDTWYLLKPTSFTISDKNLL